MSVMGTGPEVSREIESFRAMGTDVTVYGPSHDAFANVVRLAEELFEEHEQRFSRFRGDSELTKVNREAGRWTPISSAFEAMVRIALDGAASTEGAFDPTVLHAVIGAGYDRDLDEVLAGARGALHPAQPCGRWRDVRVGNREILLPDGVGLDLGGIAKGWTVDVVAEAALGLGLPWALVSAGGDMRIAGAAPLLEIPLEDPDQPSVRFATLRLDRGGLATSSTTKRAWSPMLHHVIDPRTGAPAVTDAIQATVWGETCTDAEVRATWALLLGPDAAEQLPSAIVTTDGDVHVSFRVGEAA
jgi:FAD:protein FMN transferase